MNLKTILLTSFGAASLYFGGALFYEDKKISEFIESKPKVKQYLLLDNYEKIINKTQQSYITQMAREFGIAKDTTQKIARDLELTLVHIKQQKLYLSDNELLTDSKGLDNLTKQRQQDYLFFLLSLSGFAGVFLWKCINKQEQ